MLPLDGQHKPYPFLSSPFSVRDVAFSPDGRWVAYGSNESGEYKVYVAPFPGPGGKWQVSPAGYCPRWRRDGKELYYDSADNHLMAVEVQAHAAHVELGPARALFETRSYGVFARFDVTADGERFLVPYEVGEPSTAISLVVNWQADLK